MIDRGIMGTTTWKDHLVGLGLCLTYVVALLATSADLGMSRDESFYVTAAEDYGRWFEMLFEDPGQALEQEQIDAAWDYNHEHPALIKSIFAFGWLAQSKWQIFEHESDAHRFGAMVLAGLLLWLIYIFGVRAFGRREGLFAALAFALLPRVFYHSHLNCFDIPITLMVTLVTYCYWRSLRDSRWAWATGITFGLALATKHNSWVLPGIFLIHFLWLVFARRAQHKAGADVSIPKPWWLLAMVLIGPPIFVGSWPWLWHDGLHRFGWYASFHLRHDYYNMVYFGLNYFRPPFPVAFPFVLTFFTVPLVTLALAGVGLGMRFRAMLPGFVVRRFWPKLEASQGPDDIYSDVLFVGALLAPMVIIAMPTSPIFGGTKHWFPAYPFLCLYAGLGFRKVVEAFRKSFPKVPSVAAAVGAGAVLLAPPLVETAHAHPFGLSHYGYAAGGVPGAADHGMNRQFWGFTSGSIVPFLREAMPDGGTVFICDTTWGAWQMLQKDGHLPQNIRATPNLAGADYVLVHLEHHFVEVDFQAWAAFGSVQPVHVLRYDGVPIINIYENPRRRR